jgi:two-component system, cell cycle sensor histidine kinase and response regulator CckA
MTQSEVKLQVFYEIAMAIGNSLNLKKMLQESLNTYLRKFNFAGGAVLQGKPIDQGIVLETVFSIPRRIERNKAFQAALGKIPEITPLDRLEEIIRRLPISGQHDGMHYHIMELKHFGLLILLKSRELLDGDLLKSLRPLNKKLANACRDCLRNDELKKIASDLEQENSERLKAETALNESHERLVTILNSTDVLVFVADMQTHEMIFINRSMEQLFGADAIGQPCFQVFRGKPEPCADCANEAMLKDRNQPAGLMVWEDLNPVTGKWYIHHARAIKWIDDRWVRLQISTDITELKKLERERIRDAHKLQAQRLDALGILAGGIAHEFNNLLMAILGNLSLIKFKIDESHPFERHLNKMEESIRQAAGLTDQLLGYARKGRYEDIRLQLNTLIRALSGVFIQKNASIRVHFDLSNALHPIIADRRQIQHALSNLFSNAADAMPQGGDLYIRTANVNRGDLTGKPYRIPAEEYVEIRFKDTGTGMTPEVREHIFDPFYTTKPMAAGKGAGLGMAATYGIIKAHNGFIEVISEPDQGSEFMIYLPVAVDPENPIRLSGGKAPVSRTILLIDDEELALEIGTQILEHLGYRVILARSGREAIRQFKENSDVIEVVILDMVMPEMTGIETFEQIKADFPRAKILLVSGHILDAEARLLLEHGADGFVKKPFVVEELYKAIERAARHSVGP